QPGHGELPVLDHAGDVDEMRAGLVGGEVLAGACAPRPVQPVVGGAHVPLAVVVEADLRSWVGGQLGARPTQVAQRAVAHASPGLSPARSTGSSAEAVSASAVQYGRSSSNPPPWTCSASRCAHCVNGVPTGSSATGSPARACRYAVSRSPSRIRQDTPSTTR